MCDTISVSGSLCRGGKPIFGKASDRAVNEPQPFIFVPAAGHVAGETVKCTYIEVEQVSHTNAMILAKPSWIWGAEIGVNEHGVCMGNESVFSKEMNVKEKALLGMDIVRLTLERAHTAESAVRILGELMERYGQGGNASFDTVFHYDNAYLIMDEKETWHVETAGKHYWAAKRVSGAYSISNYLSICTPDLIHSGVIENAVEKGYPIDEPFDFAKAYVDWSSPINRSGMLRRCCSFQMANKHGNHFQVEHMMETLRAHYSEDAWTDGDGCVCMHAKNPVQPEDVTCQTCCAMIAECCGRDTVMWGTGMGVTCIAPFQPFWFDAFSKKQVFPYEDMEKGVDEWIRREGINRAILDGRIPAEEYREELYGMEKKWLARVNGVKADQASRQALCDEIADEAESFIGKWLERAEKTAPAPMGTEEFQAYWKKKNAELGKDQRIAR
ncbi:C69 family dipeptidase [[Clostridium] symbiosum]|uniref:C69 family dipeptidase n=1 Tax=Clostridium symbiosum TaxID=1512 RepID=UPI001D07AC97|nr:C69 family dipeptidase [[Clostridium] symbiosum]MCB6611106.1 C69 family dipeptidase [[Clostridium] symbiosum]MCB6930252.1 C69 family dipeptidase [[Clostridium] symbiosum]